MRKLILTAFMLVGLAFSSQAQDISKNALGLRLGDNDGFGGEISYQRGLSDNNRLEFDLGWRNSNHVDAFKLVGLYQWVWNIEDGFNWYAGVGAGVGSWSIDEKYYGVKDSGSYFLAAGDIGIEYNFDFPLQLSLDFRPELYFGGDENYRDDFGPDIALGIRYRFN
ncbi:MAG: hypothetical protein CMP76_04345 [Flavobacterium sp.]|uniref:porin family protein n=1 Tax=unclassified Flavobacterium TaxID=196869 RepID=UPI000C5C2375|nr:MULTISPECIES: porin family protein [unclassified Flavobacterium]MBF02508.1 hypothetical protein [Flavobacterium sp.]MCO6163553.1 porin family protein [Flavobacterium sp. NRK F7]|tara:strand:- start:880 stop:1377 length:498 start_codon:yes stop_codon:yes gene_type:complete